MLMLLVYVLVAAYLISTSKRKALASLYAILTFVAGYLIFALIGYFLIRTGVVSFTPWYEDRAANNQYQLARLVLGALQIAFSLYLLKLVLPTGEAKNTASEVGSAMLARIKQAFHGEGAWRLFLVLQLAGIVAIVYVDLQNRSGWDFLPQLFDFRNRFEPEWDFLESYYWTNTNENWIASLGVFGPAIIAKSVGWIRSANHR